VRTSRFDLLVEEGHRLHDLDPRRCSPAVERAVAATLGKGHLRLPLS
jgi:hypothetical protein